MANSQPNFYELSGDGIQITYSTTSITGQPVLSYHDAAQAKTFTGDAIKVEETAIGTSVTVSLTLILDGPSTSFTLLLPHVRLAGPEVANIATDGITTLHKSSIAGPALGQIELYTFHALTGTARFVVF
ncbi:hypothetical protein IC762_06290 [Bradyrhizobium genosp. L]|uniref:hypothetical protein n=1 Tax=Bradyrhizobium genosp. L TaxID=83637 RepID=UPI0018A31EE5|nr:hypothetical protein [Bradyrhizobium genosp. L]QPF85911.1 hypothetical protein IC762_06290 [Bradyrhizobium genosp. L]